MASFELAKKKPAKDIKLHFEHRWESECRDDIANENVHAKLCSVLGSGLA
jgi:hypothetical protein